MATSVSRNELASPTIAAQSAAIEYPDKLTFKDFLEINAPGGVVVGTVAYASELLPDLRLATVAAVGLTAMTAAFSHHINR